MKTKYKNALNFFYRIDIYLCFIILYYAASLSFSSFFFIIDEDVEIYKALIQINNSGIIKSDMGYPYSPFSLYLLKFVSFFSGPEIIYQRLFVSVLLTISAIAVYLTYKKFLSRISSFAFTLLSFAFISFPFPRIEYFIEGSFLAITIYFAVNYIFETKLKWFIAASVFASLTFLSRGYPHGIIYLFIIPFVLLMLEDIKIFLERICQKFFSDFNPVILCTFIIFMFYIIFLFYQIINSLGSTPTIAYYGIFISQLMKVVLTTIILLFFLLFLCSIVKNGCNVRVFKKLLFYLIIHIFIFFIFNLALIASGHTFSDILFYLFPGDIIDDHQGNFLFILINLTVFLGIFVVVFVSLFFTQKNKETVDKHKIKLLIFFSIMLIPVFIRLIQLYNLFFILVYVIAIVSIIIYNIICNLPIKPLSARYLKRCFFLIIIFSAVLLNASFLYYRQIKFLSRGELINSNTGAVKGIFFEKQLYFYFDQINKYYDQSGADDRSMIIMGRAFVNYIPYIYNYKNFEDFNNIIIGLGRMRDICELYSFSNSKSDESVTNKNETVLDNNIKVYRTIAFNKLSNKKYNYLIIPYNRIYGDKINFNELEKIIDKIEQYKGEDLIVNYIKNNFKFDTVIESTIYFNESVAIFKRKS